MPYTKNEFGLTIQYGGTDSVLGGPSGINLASVGWTAVNPFDVNWKYTEQNIPDSDGAQSLSDGHMGPSDVLCTGQLVGADPEDLQTTISTFISYLHKAKSGRPYLSIALWNGAAQISYRRYVEIVGVEVPLQPKTLWQSTAQAVLRLRAIDPALYLDTVNLQTVTVTAGTGFSVVTTGGNLDTHRVTYKIIKDGANNPTNPYITTTRYGVGIVGSLVNVNDYWLLDVYNGTLIKSVSGTKSDDRANLSGEMLPLLYGADVVTVTDTATSSFKCEVRWLKRQQ